MFYPSLKTVRKLSSSFNRIPVYKELNLSELHLLSLLKSLQSKEEVIFLESARENKKWSRFSFFGFHPRKKIRYSPPVIEVEEGGKVQQIGEDIFTYLNRELEAHRSPSYRSFGPFNGGFVGYFGYETVNYTGILRRKIRERKDVPLAYLLQIDSFIVHDNHKNRYYLAECFYPQEDQSLSEQYEKCRQTLLQREEELIAELEKTSLPYLPAHPDQKTEVHFREDKESFTRKVEKVQELIRSGEAIQVVLSLRADIGEEIDPYSFYLRLRSVNPSPYMFFLKFGTLYVVGSSPEIHVKVENRKVYLKPIAGTISQGKNRTESARNKQILLHDKKERAEHLMLVDLGRNDLGRIAREGTVRVRSFMKPEDYSHVIHLVSLVDCDLHDKYTEVDVLKETFPAGTVSGAPKVRAIEIIEELESHPRDIYSGAVGYCGFNGNLDTCITIRSAVFHDDERYLQAGAGIVYDSVPEKEYQEITNKLKALAESLDYARTKKSRKESPSHVFND